MLNLKKISFFLAILFLSVLVYADTVISLGALTKANTGIVPKSGWFLLPAFTTDNLPVGDIGAIVWDSSEGVIKYYDGSSWKNVTSGSVALALDDVCANGNETSYDIISLGAGKFRSVVVGDETSGNIYSAVVDEVGRTLFNFTIAGSSTVDYANFIRLTDGRGSLLVVDANGTIHCSPEAESPAITVNNTTLCTNLNADLLDGLEGGDLVPYSGATGDVDLGTFNLTTDGKGTFGSFQLLATDAEGKFLMADKTGNGSWQSLDLSGLVPYTGATGEVNLGAHGITAVGFSGDVLSLDGVSSVANLYMAGGAFSPEGAAEALCFRQGEMRPYTFATNQSFYGMRFISAGYDNASFPYFIGTMAGSNYSRVDDLNFYVDPDNTLDTGYNLMLNNGTSKLLYTTDGVLKKGGGGNEYKFWNEENMGRNSGLDADMLDGMHNYDFLTSEVDGVIGNEIVDVADTTLTRTGTGTTEDPYQIKLNLSNANTFTANQTAPYFIQSNSYNADAPRPSGYPQTSANALDEEFNGTGAPSGWSWLSGGTNITVTQSNGFLTFKKSNGVTDTVSGYYGKSISDGDYTVAISLEGLMNYQDVVGVFFADASGTIISAVSTRVSASYSTVAVGTATSWGSISNNDGINYITPKYFGLKYNATANSITMAISNNGYDWKTAHNNWYARTTGVPSTVAYVGIYVLLYSCTSMEFQPKQISIDWLRFN